MREPNWQRGDIRLYLGDCTEIMQEMSDNSVQLLATDPPYYKVRGEAWDRQWDKPDAFLAWIDSFCQQWQRIIVPNGSLYCFASPQMAGRVEVQIWKWFCVLTHIIWDKGSGRHQKTCKESLRTFFPKTERVIFAEHFGADNIAKGEAGYAAKCDELRGFVFEPLRAYLAGEWKRAGLTAGDANKATSTQMATHYLTQSQWCLPTAEHYTSLQRYANKQGGEFLRKEYEELRKEYEELRKEYEELRKEYEELRRPFSVTPDVPYTDIWEFSTVTAYAGKHPCEKPVQLMEHIVRVSGRECGVVFDPFMGSGTTGVACVRLDRPFIGIEKERKYFDIARRRIIEAQDQYSLFSSGVS